MVRLENRNANLTAMIFAAWSIYRQPYDHNTRLELQVASMSNTIDYCNGASIPQARVNHADVRFVLTYYYQLFLRHEVSATFQPSNLKIIANMLIIEGWYDTV